MNSRAGHWADQPIPHPEWPEAGEDMRVSKAEQDDDHAGQPFGWLLVALAVTIPCALLGFWLAT